MTPWRSPRESARALEQRARNGGKRPTCRHCIPDKELAPHVRITPAMNDHGRERWIDGYGHNGRGEFCSIKCATAYGYFAVEAIRSGALR